MGDLVSTDENESGVITEATDVFENCKIRFVTDRELFNDYLPQDLCKGYTLKRSGEHNDGRTFFT